MRDITLNIISDDYEIRKIRFAKNSAGVNQPVKYLGSDKVVVKIPFDRDFLEINPCEHDRYSDDSDFINVRSNECLKRTVSTQGKTGYLYLPLGYGGCEAIVATVNDNFRIAVNAIVDEYYQKTVRVSDNGKSRVFLVYCKGDWVDKFFTVIPVDDSLVIEEYEDGFRIYSESCEVVTRNVVKQSDKQGRLHLPSSFEGKDVIMFEAADIIY